MWYHRCLNPWKTHWENEKGKWYTFLNWHFAFQYFTVVISLSLTCTVSEKSGHFYPVLEWVLGIVHLRASLQLSFISDMRSFPSCVYKLVFSQSCKRAPCSFLGLFLRRALFSPLFSTLPSGFQSLSSSSSEISLLAQWNTYALFGGALSAQWSGTGPQSECQASYRAYLICFPFHGLRPNLCCPMSHNSIIFPALCSYWKRVNLILVLHHTRSRSQLYQFLFLELLQELLF